MTTPTNPQYDAGAWTDYMDVVSSVVRTVSILPIRDMLDQLGQMETLAPILEPTAYQRGGGDNLRDQRDVLEALRGVQVAVDKITARKS